MAQGSAAVLILREPGDVFAVIADVSKNAVWAAASVEGRQTSPGPVRVGTTAREVSRFLGRTIEVDSQVTEFVADRRLAYRTSSGPFPFEGAFDVTPQPGGSRIVATFTTTATGAFRLLGPLFTWLATRQCQRDLASLKRLMESGRL